MKNMKLRRMLLEGPGDGPNRAGIENLQNPLMRLAFNNGCFMNDKFVETKDQTKGKTQDIAVQYPSSYGEAFYLESTTPDLANNKYIFLIPNEDGKTFRASYRDNQYVEKDYQPRIYCDAIVATTNPELTPDQQNITAALEQVGFRKFEDVKGKDIPNYELVNVATDQLAIDTVFKKSRLLADTMKSDLRTFQMWKSKSNYGGLSQDVRNLGGEAKRIVDYAITKDYVYPNEIPLGQGDKYELVDLSKPESYTGVLSGYSNFAKQFTGEYIMYRPKGTKNLNPRAKELIDFLITPNGGGWKPLDEFPLADRQSGELEKIDLSDGRYYSGNLTDYKDEFPSLFPKPYIIARKVNINRPNEQAGTLTQDNCRKYIEMYYDDMVNNEQKTAPSLEEKRRVETCLSTFKGRYPKLKDKIDQMMAPTSTRAAYRIKYSDEYMKGSALTQLGLRKKSEQRAGGAPNNTTSVQQESRDRLLKNIISENLMKLKKKQLLERTLLSKNTYKY